MLIDELRVIIMTADPCPGNLISSALAKYTQSSRDASRPEMLLSVYFLELQARMRRLHLKELIGFVRAPLLACWQRRKELPDISRRT